MMLAMFEMIISPTFFWTHGSLSILDKLYLTKCDFLFHSPLRTQPNIQHVSPLNTQQGKIQVCLQVQVCLAQSLHHNLLRSLQLYPRRRSRANLILYKQHPMISLNLHTHKRSIPNVLKITRGHGVRRGQA